eukprot:841031-Amphidinium_carterae.1
MLCLEQRELAVVAPAQYSPYSYQSQCLTPFTCHLAEEVPVVPATHLEKAALRAAELCLKAFRAACLCKDPPNNRTNFMMCNVQSSSVNLFVIIARPAEHESGQAANSTQMALGFQDLWIFYHTTAPLVSYVLSLKSCKDL